MVRLQALLYNKIWFVHVPRPVFGHRSFHVPPAERAAVRAAQARRHLHALVALNAVKPQLIASSLSLQHVFCPSARLHGAVAADKPVMLFLQSGFERWR